MLFGAEKIFADIYTEHLILRQPQFNDCNDVYDFCSDPGSSQYSDWRPYDSVKDAKRYISYLRKNIFDGRNDSYTWFIELKKEQRVIGTISLVSADASGSIATVGYTLNRDYQHKGFATEALKAVIRFLFEERNFTRIEAKVMIENTPSARLLERVGMTKEGVLRKGAYCKGRCVNVFIYSIIDDEFKKMHDSFV